MGSWLPTINVGDFVGNLVGDFKNGEKDLAVMQKVGILRYEGKGNVGVNIWDFNNYLKNGRRVFVLSYTKTLFLFGIFETFQ